MTLPLAGGYARRLQDAVSPTLWEILTGKAAPNFRQLAWTEKVRKEALEIADEFKARSGPMGGDKASERIAEKAKARGLDGLDADQLSRVLQPYLTALATMPEEVFDEAFTRWDAGHYFKGKTVMPNIAEVLPTPAQIVDLATPMMAQVHTASWRLRKLLEAIEALPKPKAAKMTKAEMIAAGLLNADGRVDLSPRAVPAVVDVLSEPEESF